MNSALDALCDNLGADGDRLRVAIDAIADEATGNPNARAFLAAVEWICAQPRTPAEKLKALVKLRSLPRGQVFIPSAAQFFGWSDAEHSRN